MGKFVRHVVVAVLFTGCGVTDPAPGAAACGAGPGCAEGTQCIEGTCVGLASPLVLEGAVQAKRSLDAFNSLSDTKAESAAADVAALLQACEQYMVMKDQVCPRAVADLVTAGVLTRVPKDPWDHEYQIVCPGARRPVDVSSFGPDGKTGGGDDLVGPAQ